MKYKIKTVLTNGVVDLDVKCKRYDADIDLGDHILAQDGQGNYFIDGLKAHIELRAEEDLEWNDILNQLKY